MTLEEAKQILGIERIRKLSDHTTVIETTGGKAYPATSMVQRMWEVIEGLCE